MVRAYDDNGREMEALSVHEDRDHAALLDNVTHRVAVEACRELRDFERKRIHAFVDRESSLSGHKAENLGAVEGSDVREQLRRRRVRCIGNIRGVCGGAARRELRTRGDGWGR